MAKKYRSGEFWGINNAETKGHRAQIVKKKKYISYASITHKDYTKRIKNIPLQENPDREDIKTSYVRPRRFRTTEKSLGIKYSNTKVSNPIDKSIFRKIRRKGLIK